VSARARNRLVVLVLLAAASVCHAESAKQAVRQGNQLFAKKDWQGAIAAYDKASALDPASDVPKFNKSSALYRSGDVAGAADGFKAVAGDSRDLQMVARARYNLANCAFKEGIRQKDSDLKKAVESIQQAIVGWRAVLAIQPENKKAIANIDTAAIELKKLMDEQKKRNQQQKSDPNSQQQKQEQDPNKPGQQDQQKQQDQSGKDKDQQKGEQEKKEQEKKDGQEQQKAQEQKKAPDTTAEQILNDEQDRKKELQPNQPGGYQPVDQDW
jgi:hypothetical protein